MKRRLIYADTQHASVPSELYHYTSIENLYNIMNSNKFMLGPWNNLSMTTDSSLFNNFQHVRLTIDVNMLSTQYSIYRYDAKAASAEGNDDAVDSENEWRITVSSSTHIPNFCSYISCISFNHELSDPVSLANIWLKHHPQIDSYIHSIIELSDKYNVPIKYDM